MPNYKNLGIAQGIAEGLEKSTSNLMTIMMTGNKLKQENEIFQSDKKIKDLELKKLEYELSPDQLAAKRETLRLENAAKKTAIELSLKQNKAKEVETIRDVSEYEYAMDRIKKMLNEGANTLPYGLKLKAGAFEAAGPTPGSDKDVNVNYLLGNDPNKDDWWNK